MILSSSNFLQTCCIVLVLELRQSSCWFWSLIEFTFCLEARFPIKIISNWNIFFFISWFSLLNLHLQVLNYNLSLIYRFTGTEQNGFFVVFFFYSCDKIDLITVHYNRLIISLHGVSFLASCQNHTSLQ